MHQRWRTFPNSGPAVNGRLTWVRTTDLHASGGHLSVHLALPEVYFLTRGIMSGILELQAFSPRADYALSQELPLVACFFFHEAALQISESSSRSYASCLPSYPSFLESLESCFYSQTPWRNLVVFSLTLSLSRCASIFIGDIN